MSGRSAEVARLKLMRSSVTCCEVRKSRCSMSILEHMLMVLQIAAASRQAGVSTASMGKFDATLPGEKPGERTLAVRRHKFDPVAGSAAKENKKVSSQQGCLDGA